MTALQITNLLHAQPAGSRQCAADRECSAAPNPERQPSNSLFGDRMVLGAWLRGRCGYQGTGAIPVIKEPTRTLEKAIKPETGEDFE